ncbi:hypothetical protein FA95DRAFT_1577224 [Auriscalpium vulgare]|uniref:Uncharacterized protein n=1 Tax=Auriscalpium vulgare TaxID=40419 RepID=A0ACB8R7Z7_9AGAM|nr:hypothetical protein FA95DRAFT_1577224 [Auriscalpium vulgare]
MASTKMAPSVSEGSDMESISETLVEGSEVTFVLDGETRSPVSPTIEDILNLLIPSLREVTMDIPRGTDLSQAHMREPPTFRHLRHLNLCGEAKNIAILLSWFRPHPAEVSLDIKIVDLAMEDINLSFPKIWNILKKSSKSFTIEATQKVSPDMDILILNGPTIDAKVKLIFQDVVKDIFVAAFEKIFELLPKAVTDMDVKIIPTTPAAKDILDGPGLVMTVAQRMDQWITDGQRCGDLTFPVSWLDVIGKMMDVSDTDTHKLMNMKEEWITMYRSTKKTNSVVGWLVCLGQKVIFQGHR